MRHEDTVESWGSRVTVSLLPDVLFYSGRTEKWLVGQRFSRNRGNINKRNRWSNMRHLGLVK